MGVAMTERHRLGVGGTLGVPDEPRICSPGIGNAGSNRKGWRKGTSGIPAASDHGHPLEAVRLTVYETTTSDAIVPSNEWTNWGGSTWEISYYYRDEACALAFQYSTSFYIIEADCGLQFGIYSVENNYVYETVARHYKNVTSDHCQATGTIVVPAGFNTPGNRRFRFQWRRYNGPGRAVVDFNDFAQLMVYEYYTTDEDGYQVT